MPFGVPQHTSDYLRNSSGSFVASYSQIVHRQNLRLSHAEGISWVELPLMQPEPQSMRFWHRWFAWRPVSSCPADQEPDGWCVSNI